MTARGLWNTVRLPRDVVMSLLLITLAGCSARVPVSTPAEPTIQPPPSSMLAEPTLVPSAAPMLTAAEGFAIYLLDQSISSQQLASLSRLKLEETPFLSNDDIVSYTEAAHEIELTDTGYEKIHGLSVPMDGKPFAVCVDGQPIYSGAFWVAFSSASFDGVIIEVLLVSEERHVMRIELGYPGSDFFQGADPRSDSRIMQALEQAGKLK